VLVASKEWARSVSSPRCPVRSGYRTGGMAAMRAAWRTSS